MIPSGVYFVGAGPASTIIKACGTLSTTAIMLETANWNTTNCEGWLASGGSTSQYTSCPYGFGIVGLMFDGNAAGRGVASSSSCVSTSSVTKVCANVALRGNRFRIVDCDFINSPWDGLYREMPSNVSTAPYLNYGSTVNYGNAGLLQNLHLAYNTNNGETAFGPPDSQENSVLAFWNGSSNGSTNYGQFFGCLPTSSGNVCAGANYVSNGHNFHNYAWGYEVETPIIASNIQSESNQNATAGCGIHVNVPGSPAGNNYGQLQATNVLVWNNQGTCNGIQFDSPPSTYTYFPGGNTISGLQAFTNSGSGIGVAGTAAQQTHVVNESVSGNTSGTNYSPAVGKLICILGNASAITGNGAAQDVFTCTIPAYFVQPGHVINWKSNWSHSTGSASVTYQYGLGGVAASPTWATTDTGGFQQNGQIYITGTGASNGTTFMDAAVSSGTPGIVGSSTSQGATSTFTTGADAALTFTFTVASSDKVTPKEFFVTAY